MTERKIAIVGGGLIGRAWAIVFARGGCSVAIFDPEPGVAARARAAIAEAFDDLAREGFPAEETPSRLLARIVVADSLAEALEGAIYVQENAPEVLETKAALMTEMDALADPETVLASSTSGFVPSSLTENVPGRGLQGRLVKSLDAKRRLGDGRTSPG